MLNDLRYAFRTLRQNPGYAITAIVSIGLGIGANATIFSLADGLLFRPLPVPNAAQVVTVKSRTPSGTFGNLSYLDYVDFRDKSRSFDGVVAYQFAPFGFAADAKTQPQLKVGFLVSGNFFQVLGTEPEIGRGFSRAEDQAPGRDAVAVLGYDFWKNEFASNTAIVGRHIRLNGLDFTIVGVAPESFTGMDQYLRPSFFLPAMMAPALRASKSEVLTDRSDRSFTVKGRLKPGVSIQAADAEADALAKSLAQSYPATNHAFGAAVRTEMQTRRDFSQGDVVLVSLLFSLVIVVLLIACGNVANLMLSRGRDRAREIAVRLAIGASRVRLVRQLMVESLLIALAGGALGLLIALFGVEVLSTIQIPSDIPIQVSFQLDGRVLAMTILVSFACAILFGLIPALQSTKTDLVPSLKAGAADISRRRLFGRNALVTLEVAGALVLLVAATQLSRGFSYALSHSPGFRTDHLIMMSFDTALVRYNSAQTEQFYKSLTERARAVPGVKSAALTFSVPMGTNNQFETVAPEGYQFPRGKDSDVVLSSVVDHNFFETLGVPVLRGRPFLATDRGDSPRVAMVNEAFADRYLGKNPIGKRIQIKDREKGDPWVEVVGVTTTGRYFSIVEPPIEYLYLPLSQNPRTRMTLFAQTYGDPAALAGPLRKMAGAIDSNVPIFGVRTMANFFEQRAVRTLHLIDGIVGVAGLLGLALALVGLYAVMAYQVARRTREIGIRMAIGAARPQVMKMILKQAGTMAATGACIGMLLCFAGSLALTIGMGAPSFDPVLFALVPIGLLLTTLLAAAIPARRAARIDPMRALRQE
jgi:predicted permease